MLALITMPLPNLTSALEILSAMITPAVLILACGSLIMTTSSRSIRAVDRVREYVGEMEKLADTTDEASMEKRRLIVAQLDRLTNRVRILQRAIARLYGAVTVLIATSVTIGIISLTGARFAWVPLIFGFIGAALLFSASVLLIMESRIALTSIDAEMDYVSKLGRQHIERISS